MAHVIGCTSYRRIKMECDICGTVYTDDTLHEHEAVIIREGSSTRTSDELAEQFVNDALTLGVVLDDFDSRYFARVVADLADHRWLEDPELVDIGINDLVMTVEDLLDGYCVVWDDGYVIYRTDVIDADDEHDDDPADAPSGFLPLGTGGLRDEIAYAESFTDDE